MHRLGRSPNHCHRRTLLRPDRGAWPQAGAGPEHRSSHHGCAGRLQPRQHAVLDRLTVRRPPATGTSADNRVGGTAGTKEVNAAVGNNIATSSQDVRRQQEGLPTVAAAGSGKSVETTPGQGSSAAPNDRMSQAKMELKKAGQLDQKDDPSCRGSIDRTRQLMG